MQRLIETEELESGDTYTLLEMMTDLRNSLFREISRGDKTDAFRRNIQRAYIYRMAYIMTENPELTAAFSWRTSVNVSQSDIRAVVRGELNRLNRTLKNNAYRSDRMTQYHVQDLSKRIEEILDGEDD